VIGALQRGGMLAVCVDGAQQHQTGLQIEITGTQGILRLSNARAFQNLRNIRFWLPSVSRRGGERGRRLDCGGSGN
jgi:hypothetical protein